MYIYKVSTKSLKHVLGVRVFAHFILLALEAAVWVATVAHFSLGNSLNMTVVMNGRYKWCSVNACCVVIKSCKYRRKIVSNFNVVCGSVVCACRIISCLFLSCLCCQQSTSKLSRVFVYYLLWLCCFVVCCYGYDKLVSVSRPIQWSIYLNNNSSFLWGQK